MSHYVINPPKDDEPPRRHIEEHDGDQFDCDTCRGRIERGEMADLDAPELRARMAAEQK